MNIRRLAIVLFALAIIVAACSDSGASEDPVDESTNATVETDAGTPEASEGGELVATDGDIVEVHYVGTLDDGSQFDSSRERGTPLTFTLGTGEVISGFDDAVRGTKVGDVNTVRMEAADAYGEPSDEFIIDVPFNPEQGDIEVGDQVFLNNGQPATILAITDETVTLDANHPLAGEALTFEIEVLSITRS
jgi:FKBP-type peptidyl-prolyl cis-trans isomerase 2